MSLALEANREVVKDYFRLFVNRQAYVVQSMRPHPKSGHFYYYRPKAKGTDKPMCLTDDTIRRHLEGALTVGLYAIDPASQRCKWVAIDADYKDAMEDLLKLQFYLTQDHVSPALEMSRRGGHLWIFLEAPQLARDCRIYIYNLALRLGVPVKGAGAFNILDHVRNPRKVGRNYVARCPSCAEAGHDRSGDNLAISIDEPRKYKCWAGCTKEMIRAALGFPIPIRQSA